MARFKGRRRGNKTRRSSKRSRKTKSVNSYRQARGGVRL